MTTPLYPAFEKRIADAVGILLRKQLEPWAFFNSGHQLKLTTFDGRTISYSGIGFEGSPRQVFWSRYIEPFLEDLAITQISSAVREARERNVDGSRLLKEVEGLLLAGCRRVYARMAQIDQRLLGKGFPQNVPLRATDREYKGMREFIEKHIRAELEMWKPRRRLEEWYERNRFWVWAVGILVGLGGLVAPFL